MQAERWQPRKENNSHIGRFEKLPHKVIDDVVINEQMRDTVADPLVRRYLVDKDYAINRAAIFSLGPSGEGMPRLQAPTMHRCVILSIFHEPVFDENGVAFEKIVAKGSGYSAANGGISLSGDPLGLFGITDANDDMAISNTFAAKGGRTSRGLFSLVLNHAKFLDWFHKHKKTDVYRLEEQVQIVERNHDVMAIYARLMAAERIPEYSTVRTVDSYYAPQLIRQRAARLLTCEITKWGQEDFIAHYGLDRLRNAPFDSQSLLCLTALSPSDLVSFLGLYFHYFNCGVMDVVSAKDYGNILRMPAETQNNDIVGFVYDWEDRLSQLRIPGVIWNRGRNATYIATRDFFSIPFIEKDDESWIINTARLNGVKMAHSPTQATTLVNKNFRRSFL